MRSHNEIDRRHGLPIGLCAIAVGVFVFWWLGDGLREWAEHIESRIQASRVPYPQEYIDEFERERTNTRLMQLAMAGLVVAGVVATVVGTRARMGGARETRGASD